MKLSVKIASIFAAMTVITIILYLMSAKVMVDYLYQGEVTHITDITSDIMSRLQEEKDKLISKAKDYKELLPNIIRMDEDYDADFIQELSIYKWFEDDGIQSKIILSPEFRVYKTYYDKEEKIIEEAEVDTLIKEVKKLTQNTEQSFEGVISTNNHPYIVAIYPLIDGGEKEHRGYFMAIEAIDQEMIGKIGNDLKRRVDLTNRLDPLRARNLEESYIGVPIHLVYDKSIIESYAPVGTANAEEKFYVRLTEPLLAKQSTKQNIETLTGVLMIVCIITNCILGVLVEKLVVKRIVKIDKQINNIHSSQDLSKHIEKDEVNDEIGMLEEDINRMFDSLEQANEHILLNEKKYSSVLSTMPNGFACYRVKKDELGQYKDAICEECNDALGDLLGVSKEKLINNTIHELSHIAGIDDRQIQEILGQVWRTDRTYTLSQVALKGDKWASITLYSIQQGYFAIIINDITTLKHYSEEMKYLAKYDSLTHLKNRHSLYEHLDYLKKMNVSFVIYFIDLDNFKTLNDTVGHIEGDKVLCTTAKELMELANDYTTIGRLGGDEFIVIREGEFAPNEIAQFGQNLLNRVNKKFEYASYNFAIKASIGISIYPYQTSDINTLLKYGDIAMYRSKKKGGNSIQVFTDEMSEELEVEASLKDVIARGEIVPYYQPIFDIHKKKIVGAEVLSRWIRNGEVLLPEAFIPVAKRIGCIVEIDYLMLDKACEFGQKWHMNGYTDLEMYVNMSYRSLKRPNCVEIIKGILNKYHINPELIRLEIAEGEVVDYPEYIVKVLNEIKALGIKISLDDFGIGYSSFNHVKVLPLDILKIDQLLVSKIEKDERNVAIIGTLIELAHILGLEVICEGVEVSQQIDILKEIKCDKIQGYYISQPVEEMLFYKCFEHYSIN
ncbi:MAG: EAL domain-containing protein [Candidatus Niameybacter stercoravium]|nr:EAL domain-containing protein [Candidatus Niameybacter stercoravium]